MWRRCQRRRREACEGYGGGGEGRGEEARGGGSSPTHSQIQRRRQEDEKCNSNPQHQEEPVAEEKVGRLRTRPTSSVNRRQQEKRHARGRAHFSGQRRGEARGPHRSIPAGRREGKVLIPGRKSASSRPQQSPSSRGPTDRQGSGRSRGLSRSVRRTPESGPTPSLTAEQQRSDVCSSPLGLTDGGVKSQGGTSADGASGRDATK